MERPERACGSKSSAQAAIHVFLNAPLLGYGGYDLAVGRDIDDVRAIISAQTTIDIFLHTAALDADGHDVGRLDRTGDKDGHEAGEKKEVGFHGAIYRLAM